MSVEYGDRIREVRRQHGLSQNDFAAALDVSVITVNRIENGHRDPDISMIRRLALKFDVDPAWLVLGRAGGNGIKADSCPVYERNELLKDKEQRTCSNWLSIPEMPNGCFACKMPDESMLPDIHVGDFLLITDGELEPGDLGLFGDDYGLVLVRRLGIKDGEQYLVPVNVKYPIKKLTAGYRCLGKVVSTLRSASFTADVG